MVKDLSADKVKEWSLILLDKSKAEQITNLVKMFAYTVCNEQDSTFDSKTVNSIIRNNKDKFAAIRSRGLTLSLGNMLFADGVNDDYNEFYKAICGKDYVRDINEEKIINDKLNSLGVGELADYSTNNILNISLEFKDEVSAEDKVDESSEPEIIHEDEYDDSEMDADEADAEGIEGFGEAPGEGDSEPAEGFGEAPDNDTEPDIEKFNAEQEELEKKAEAEEAEYKESLDKGEVAGKAKQNDSDTEDVDPEIEEVVDNLIDNIKAVYVDMYAPMFLNPPTGVICTHKANKRRCLINCGRANSNDGSVKLTDFRSESVYAKRIYDEIDSLLTVGGNHIIREAPVNEDEDGMDIDTSWMHPDGSMKYNYIPYVQVRNCNGIYKDNKTGEFKRAKNWVDFESKYFKDIRPTFIKLMNRTDRKPASIRKAGQSILALYTNVLLAESLDKKKLCKLTIHIDEVKDSKTKSGYILESVVNSIINSNSFDLPSKTSYKVMSNSRESLTGTQRIFLVLNEKRFQGELGFAYKTVGKILQSGGKLSISNVIIGRTLDGKPYSINLGGNDVMASIIAGSRSGKGVLTLAMLAYMYANMSPVFYIDYKPDMSKTLWDLQDAFNSDNSDGKARILTVDGAGGTPNIYGGKLKPAYKPLKSLRGDLTGNLNVLPYAKAIQLSAFIAQCRCIDKDRNVGLGPKAFIIFDEAQKAASAIRNASDLVAETLKKYKVTKDGGNKAENEYLLKLHRVLTSTTSAMSGSKDTFFGKGKVMGIILGQSISLQNNGGWQPPFKLCVKESNFRIMGRETDSGTGELSVAKLKSDDVALNTGLFAVNAKDKSRFDVVKTELVLNEISDSDVDINAFLASNGEDSSAIKGLIGELLSNVDADNKKMIFEDDIVVSESNKIAASPAGGQTVGTVNKLLGFKGYVEFLGRNLGGNFNIKDAASAGYNLAYKYLNAIGVVGKGDGYKYSSVEAYLYSAEPDSLLATEAMASAYEHGASIYELGDNIDEYDPADADKKFESGEEVVVKKESSDIESTQGINSSEQHSEKISIGFSGEESSDSSNGESSKITPNSPMNVPSSTEAETSNSRKPLSNLGSLRETFNRRKIANKPTVDPDAKYKKAAMRLISDLQIKYRRKFKKSTIDAIMPMVIEYLKERY